MTEQEPEIVAAANLSPLASSPISIQSSPSPVPSLQDQAENLDVATLDLAVAHHPVAMASARESTEPSETIDVAGRPSDGSQVSTVSESDSLDAYDEEVAGQNGHPAPASDNSDDFAKSFESPPPEDAVAGHAVGTQSLQPKTTSANPSPRAQSSSGDAVLEAATQEDVAQRVQAEKPEHSSTANASDALPPSGPVSQQPSAEPTPTSDAPVLTTDGQDDDDVAFDIEKLVDDITARTAADESVPTASAASASPPSTTSVSGPAASIALSSASSVTHAQHQLSLALATPSSLPPKPNFAGQRPVAPEYRSSPNSASISPMSRNPIAPAHPGAPGSTATAPGSFSASPPYANGLPNTGVFALSDMQQHQAWETFQADERRYMTEQKWERFPEGSRVFIGNLSSDRVAKREVFDMFSPFGRLAQISLKSAYGFVQYHTSEDALKALQAAEGTELGGRKIHLEISRTQKKKADDHERSPQWKQMQRDDRGNRFDTRDQGRRGRDDYRPGRSPSPRRRDGRGGFHYHSRDSFDRRGRSRSPPSHQQQHPRGGRFDDPYRRRSPSPRRAPIASSDHVDIPRRYGNDVPDVQFLLTQELQREFVEWVHRPFLDRGLKVDVLYLNPRIPREVIVQRQVLEGVHAIIELDYEAQRLAKLSVEVFHRSGGASVRFDRYEMIDPPIAAELVVREKSQSAAVPTPAYPPNQYGQQYPPSTYAQFPQGAAQAPPQAPVQPIQPATPAVAPDLANLMGQLDNNSLQSLLTALQAGQTASPNPHTSKAGPQTASGQPSTVDIQALLGNLQAAASHPAAAPNYGYGNPGEVNSWSAGAGAHDSQQQSIMDTLARFRR